MTSPTKEMHLRQINQLLNRTARALNKTAVELANSNHKQLRQKSKGIANALEILVDIQGDLYALDPDLEYHYDPNRKKTKYMQHILALTSAAKEFEEKGDKKSAIENLKVALETEPPPLTYEAIEKEIARLRER